MPQPHLPTELLGKICADDAAVADSTPSLFALCLTSRTFRNLSQPHLYRNLDITHLPDPLEESGYALKRCSAALRETLGKRPQLARECRSLTLTFRTRAEGERFKSGSTPTCEGFATLFELLGQVEVFKVNYDGTGRYPPAELDRALACMESWRNTLYRVKLHALSRDAMRFLLAKPHLEFLDVGQVARDCVPRAQSVAPFHLTALIYDDFAADAFLTLTSSSHASLVNLIAPFFFVGAGEEARAK